jgi:hypothetical protein
VLLYIIRNFSSEFFVHVRQDFAEEFLGILLRVALELRAQLLDGPQDIFGCVVVRRYVLAPVPLEPIREGHKKLLAVAMALI